MKRILNGLRSFHLIQKGFGSKSFLNQNSLHRFKPSTTSQISCGSRSYSSALMPAYKNLNANKTAILSLALSSCLGLFAVFQFKNTFLEEKSYEDKLVDKLVDLLENGDSTDSPSEKVLITNLTKDEIGYTLDDVANHNKPETGIWVTYKDGVYDITEFVAEHPGGAARIMLAAGGSIDQFWRLYQQHFTEPVQEILAELRIGTLKLSEYEKKLESSKRDDNDPYGNDPERHPGFIVHKDKPFNAEVPAALLNGEYITPNELFFVRHHHPVPVIKGEEYRLVINGKGLTNVNVDENGNEIEGELILTLDDIKNKFKKHSITTTIQCGGNRRAMLDESGETQGLKWSIGAISTAEWSGARLKDVLEFAGLKDYDQAENEGVKHVQFFPVDEPFDASIPIEKAMNPYGDVLLAYEMNGKELPAEHGYPIRTVVPGGIGARQVKWCIKITTSDEESYSVWQRGPQYKGFSPNVKQFDNKRDYHKESVSVQEMPVQSAITNPNLIVDPTEDEVEVQGYAWSGGGRGIVRVDVTADEGKTWFTADLNEGKDQNPNRAWGWTLWSASIPIPEDMKKDGSSFKIHCKAVDASYNQQPEKVSQLWNLRGILNNSWHWVKVDVKATPDDDADS